jgi:hypothetical protein
METYTAINFLTYIRKDAQIIKGSFTAAFDVL